MIIYRKESSRILSAGFRMVVTSSSGNQEDETGRAIWVDKLLSQLLFMVAYYNIRYEE